MTPDPAARRRALRAALAALEAYALAPGQPYDPAVSLILDALHDAEEATAVNLHVDDAVPPDHPPCDACGKPCYLIPPGWMERPRQDNEPPTPVRIALCDACGDQPGVGSQLVMERMRALGMLWPRQEEDAA